MKSDFHCTEHFRKKSHVSFLFWSDHRQQIPVCAKISSLVRIVLIIAKADTSLGTFKSVVASAAFVADVSLVSVLQASDWASFYPSYNFF